MRNDRAMIRLLGPAALAGLVCLVLTACASTPTPRSVPTVTKTVTVRPSPSPMSARGAGPMLAPESCLRVTIGADGNVGPVTCPDGHPNAYSMPALQSVAPHMLGLGEFATPAVIQDAACADLANGSTFPIEESAYKFAMALNGWSLGIDPTNGGIFTFCG